jgi:hypothetical protein
MGDVNSEAAAIRSTPNDDPPRGNCGYKTCPLFARVQCETLLFGRVRSTVAVPKGLVVPLNFRPPRRAIAAAHLQPAPVPGVNPRYRQDRIAAPPGHLLMLITEFLFSRKTFVEVFVATAVDFRDEHAHALACGRVRKARWIAFRGNAALVSAALDVVAGNLLRWMLSFWR